MVLCQVVLSLGLFFGLTTYCGAYSVLTHEEVVDLLWKDDIQPLLLKRFPGSSAEDLKKAMLSLMEVAWYRTWATIHSATSTSAT